MERIYNPFPASLRCESRKSMRILESFIRPSSLGSPGLSLPPHVLKEAKGLVVFTVFRVGFLGSARFGSGVMVARLDDGSWSSPSAIEILGGGFGGLIGIKMTDFVFVLNDPYAVRTFSQCGSALLSANLLTAFGPVGRSVEVAGGASAKGAAATFAYSKTKGIYAGVSLEGAIMIERRGANRKLYKQKVKASQVLTGAVAPPPE